MPTRSICLLFLLLPLQGLQAQTPADTCVDKIYLRNGSVFLGHLREYVHGEKVVLQTHTGTMVNLPGRQVKRVVQSCPGDKRGKELAPERPYTFRERGLYNHSRLAFLPGQNFYGDLQVGLSIYHSIGWMLQRRLGVGVAAGMEAYEPGGIGSIVTVPVMAEVRGYLAPRRVSAYYHAALGYGFASREQETGNNWRDSNWRGGWIAKGQIGVRFGNHFTVHTGLSFQRATQHWTSPWSPGEFGYERRLFKRLEVGIGVLL